MWLNLFVLVLCFNEQMTVNSLKILGVLNTPARSHFYPFDTIIKGLADKGHQVTVISFYGRETPHPNIEDIILRKIGATSDGVQTSSQEMFQFNECPNISHDKGFKLLREFANISCNDMFSKPFQNFLHSNKSYDLLILEAFSTDCYLGLVDKFKAPLIQYSSSTILPIFHERFGQPDNSAYISSILAGYSGRMHFWKRVQNTMIHWLHILRYKRVIVPENFKIAKQVYGDDLRPFEQIASEASLMLLNTHFTHMGARPNVPGIIEIGGIHIGAVKKLPKVSLSKLLSKITKFMYCA